MRHASNLEAQWPHVRVLITRKVMRVKTGREAANRTEVTDRSTNHGIPHSESIKSGWQKPAQFLYAVHVRQLGGGSPLHNLMEVK
jgi:hypothetical protein